MAAGAVIALRPGDEADAEREQIRQIVRHFPTPPQVVTQPDYGKARANMEAVSIDPAQEHWRRTLFSRAHNACDLPPKVLHFGGIQTGEAFSND